MTDRDSDVEELAALDGVKRGDDGRLRAKIAWNAKAAKVSRDD